MTAYGGVLFAQGYDAATGGVGLNLPIGALTLDATYARTFAPGKTYTGTGWRLAYTKKLAATDTEVTLAMLRYANKGFNDPQRAFELIDRAKRGDAIDSEPPRAQLSVNLSQPLPHNLGAVSLSGSVQTYWNRPGQDIQYHFGYGRNFGRVSASFTASRSKNTASGRWENQYLLNLSLPLRSSNSGSQNRVYLSSSVARRRS